MLISKICVISVPLDMKTGLGLYRKFRMLYSYLNLFRFGLRKLLLGFDVASIFLHRLDKQSIQLILRKFGATIGKDCDIESGQVFHNCKDFSNLRIGKNCHIGKNCFFDLREEIRIEDNVVISMQTTIITHQDMEKSVLSRSFPGISKPVLIKNDSYIGANSTILMGAVLNEGSFIAAGSLVTNEVPDFTMEGGVPAKFLKKIEKK